MSFISISDLFLTINFGPPCPCTSAEGLSILNNSAPKLQSFPLSNSILSVRLFLLNFIKSKFQENKVIHTLNANLSLYSLRSVLLRVLGLTFLNPHVYSDTVFILGNISKNFLVHQKISFGIGASLS